MSVTVIVTLDDATGAYLERVAADQDRTPDELATLIVTEDLRHQRRVDAELVARLDAEMVSDGAAPRDHSMSLQEGAPCEHASA